MQWSDLVSQLSYYCQQETPDASFTLATPNFVNNAELRIYRDLDFAAAGGQNASLQTTALQRSIDLTVMTGHTVNGTPVAYAYPVVIEGLAAKVGNRWVQFQLVSLDFLDAVWPDQTLSAAPTLGLAYYNVLDNQTILIAPPPDQIYQVRVSGEWRPKAMSAANPITWLGDNVPDLLFCAVMVEAMGYQRDFGAAAENPQAALSWEGRYQDAKRSAMLEEALRKGQGPDYQAYPPAPLAHPQAPQGPQS
jgi:hypothetical protein